MFGANTQKNKKNKTFELLLCALIKSDLSHTHTLNYKTFKL